MSKQQILAAAQRAYEASDKRLIMSFENFIRAEQKQGRFWGIPQEGEENE